MKPYICAILYALSSMAAASALAGGGLPSNTEHQVKAGDTLERIAKRYAGDEKHANLILEMNPHLNDVGLQAGDHLFVPDARIDEASNEKVSTIKLPPSPVAIEKHFAVVPGIKYGLAHVERGGKFVIVQAPVDKD